MVLHSRRSHDTILLQQFRHSRLIEGIYPESYPRVSSRYIQKMDLDRVEVDLIREGVEVSDFSKSSPVTFVNSLFFYLTKVYFIFPYNQLIHRHYYLLLGSLTHQCFL